MKQVYQQIENSEHIPNIQKELIPIPHFPTRKAEFAYHWKRELNIIQKKDILELRDQLGIYYNLRTSQINERTKRLSQTQSGWKEIKGVYFFFHEKQLYIIVPLQKSEVTGKDRITTL